MMHVSIQSALIIDVLTLLLCGIVALRCASTPLHPSLMMLGCHGYIVTIRLWQLLRGANPMSYTFVWPVQLGEILRASLSSDVALIAMASAWVLVRFWSARRSTRPREPRVALSFSRVRLVAVMATLASIAAIGIIGPHQLQMQPNPNSTLGAIQVAVAWAPLTWCLLLFIYGFTFPLVCCTVISLVITMMLSVFRGVVIVPLVFLLFTWLARKQSRRIPLAFLPAVAVLWLIWLPMKPIVYALQAGKSISESFSTGIQVAFENFGKETGSGIDFQFLDMIGSTMTLVDIHGTHFWGSTIEPVLVSPVPRAFWANKPHLNKYQQDLDIPGRRQAALNMTAGLIGQSYADFGYAGVVATPFLISLAFSAAYSRLAGTSILSPGGLLYLLYLSTYMQLYRDGLVSAVWFPFVNLAPIGWLAVSHWILPPRLARRVHAPLVGPVQTDLTHLLPGSVR